MVPFDFQKKKQQHSNLKLTFAYLTYQRQNTCCCTGRHAEFLNCSDTYFFLPFPLFLLFLSTVVSLKVHFFSSTDYKNFSSWFRSVLMVHLTLLQLLGNFQFFGKWWKWQGGSFLQHKFNGRPINGILLLLSMMKFQIRELPSEKVSHQLGE